MRANESRAFVTAMGILEKISEVEKEIARTQKNKGKHDGPSLRYTRVQVSLLFVTATEYHLGLLKAKLAKYRSQLLEPTGKAGAKVKHLRGHNRYQT